MLRTCKSVLCGLLALAVVTTVSIVDVTPAQARERVVRTEGRTRAEIPAGQEQLFDAMKARRGLNFVEVEDLEVVEILPDDNHGRRHQKFVVSLANGVTMMAVYNIDVAKAIPVREGDLVGLAGEYIWEKDGGLMHWLHEDPRDKRPDGYVMHDGVKSGEFHGGKGNESYGPQRELDRRDERRSRRRDNDRQPQRPPVTKRHHKTPVQPR